MRHRSATTEQNPNVLAPRLCASESTHGESSARSTAMVLVSRRADKLLLKGPLRGKAAVAGWFKAYWDTHAFSQHTALARAADADGRFAFTFWQEKVRPFRILHFADAANTIG